MAIGPRSKPEERVNLGFNWAGAVMRSALEINNEPTAFVQHLIGRVWKERLSPRQLVDLIAMQRPELRRMFTMPSMDQWQRLDRWWQWPCAAACNSAEVTVKFGGRHLPLWTEDPYAWEHEVRKACAMRNEDVPHDHAGIDELLRSVGE